MGVRGLDRLRHRNGQTPAHLPSTYSNYKTNINAYIRPAFGARRLQDVSVPMLNAFYLRLLESGRVKADTNFTMYKYWQT